MFTNLAHEVGPHPVDVTYPANVYIDVEASPFIYHVPRGTQEFSTLFVNDYPKVTINNHQ